MFPRGGPQPPRRGLHVELTRQTKEGPPEGGPKFLLMCSGEADTLPLAGLQFRCVVRRPWCARASPAQQTAAPRRQLSGGPSQQGHSCAVPTPLLQVGRTGVSSRPDRHTPESELIWCPVDPSRGPGSRQADTPCALACTRTAFVRCEESTRPPGGQPPSAWR